MQQVAEKIRMDEFYKYRKARLDGLVLEIWMLSLQYVRVLRDHREIIIQSFKIFMLQS